ncbi:MAG TPA: tRNA (adenosine(37)-N6)-dimethylallyltransferase MiaA [Candidatus Magasanikbacteria bacterium]|nr:MAG: tRNA dimethylallyltransferase [Candidatus Magasanikbacteria bacterium GW2011_GWC2_41_17]HBV58284.1 tRNA (adenosine(37)-N6)-dimethylallyltransferase MiaA [Candidatus Magasanikbacteria bacterium]HBX15792.1 tRNA (adenosine(37)-N6)-dimethylallyltransferase MiaA [Candidatus Magasanikbacteria bacterium]
MEIKPVQKLSKLVVVLGPTASGKTDFSIELAKKFNGEIISADSRQIYKKMNIGTAKVRGAWQKDKVTGEKVFVYENIPHHLVDFIDPGDEFSLAQFKALAIARVNEIISHGKLPMLVGGTGLYIQAVVDNLLIPAVPPNKKLRQSLEEKTNQELVELLKKLDPVATRTIDADNKRRLIRALEVCIWTGKTFSGQQNKGESLFECLQIGLSVPRDELNSRIAERAEKMMERGLLEEVRALVKQRYGWNLPSMSGTGYKQFAGYFKKEISLENTVELLKRDTRRYARRQMTWFKRDAKIKWVDNVADAAKLIMEFLN